MDIPQDNSMFSMPRVIGKPYATDDMWNCHRSIITRLYQEENKTLKQLKQIMERDYNLFATERMFKTRIKNWGLDKKLKEAEVLRILQLKQERDLTGKKSSFYIRNQEVDWDRLAHYLSRRPDLRNKFRDFAQDPRAARLDITCRTPSPGPSVSALLNEPLEIRLPDEILRIYRSYLQGAWESVWTLEGDGLYGYDRERGHHRLVKMYGNLGNARTLLRRNKLQAAFRLINQSLDSLGPMIKGQDPGMIYIFSYCTSQLDKKIAETLTMFISEMHAIVLGSRHPLSLVWDKFRHISWECRARVIRMMAFDDTQFLETRLRIMNRVIDPALTPTTSYLYRLGETDIREIPMVLSKYAAAAETYLEEGDTLKSCECLLRVARVHSKVRQYNSARDALSRAFALVQDNDRSPCSPWLVMELGYYELMGSLLYDCGPERIAESLEYEYKAYKHAETYFPENIRSLRAFLNLLYRLRLGREEDAEQ